MKPKLETGSSATGRYKTPSADEYKELIGNPRKLQAENFSKEEVEILWRDLNEVGSTKAVGHLPIDTLFYGLGVVDLKTLSDSYIQKGFKSKIYFDRTPPEKSSLALGFVAVWDEKMLQKLLNENGKLLKASGWPQNATQFMDKISTTTVPKGELYDLIAKAFNDPRYRS